jgi:hypothetical protein
MLAPVWRRVDALEPHSEQMELPERGCSDGPFLRWVLNDLLQNLFHFRRREAAQRLTADVAGLE